MNDMRAVIVPKSDQMNADDLIGGSVTITIREITIRPGTEQPVSIFYEGDNGKPYKPCKSMARVMVECWEADAKKYVGQSMTLYRDPKVKWGGMAVGGIRISHISGITETKTLALTETKGSRKPFVVKPLEAAPATSNKPDQWRVWTDKAIARFDATKTLAEITEIARKIAQNRGDLRLSRATLADELDAAQLRATERVTGSAPSTDELPPDNIPPGGTIDGDGEGMEV